MAARHAGCVLARATRGAVLVATVFSPCIALAGPAAPAPGQATDSGTAVAPGQVPDAPPPLAETAAPPAETSLPTVETAAPARVAPVRAAPAPAVDDATWNALKGRDVIIETPNGPVQGELADAAGPSLVIVGQDGQVASLPKSQATGVRVAKAPPPAATPKEELAALGPAEPAAADEDEEEEGDAKDEEEEEEEELTEGQKRRKERREKREHAILGAFTMHGATYSYWRGDGVNGGGASYAMDFGVGGNFSPKFGMYAMAGGLLGAKIEDDNRNANYGHVAGLFVFGGKWYYSTVGAGAAFSRLRDRTTDDLQKDTGLAMPFKLMGKIPLPKKLYIGLGLSYEFAAFRGFSRFVNAIGGQIVFGRW